MMKNQKGYAFLLVLGTIVIIGLLVPPLAYQILSSSTQASQTEQSVQLDNMYDMGKQMGRRHVEMAFNGEANYQGYNNYIQEIIDKKLTENKTLVDSDVEITWEMVEDYFNQALDGKKIKIGDLKLDNDSAKVNVHFLGINKPIDQERLEITYEITPIVGESNKEALTETFYLDVDGQGGSGVDLEWDGNVQNLPFYDDDNVIDDNTFNFQGNAPTIDAGTVFKGNKVMFPNSPVKLTGPLGFFPSSEVKITGNTESVTINGNSYFSGHKLDLKQDVIFIINGNAHFSGIDFKFQSNKVAKMCVDGNIYDYGGNNFEGARDDGFHKVDSFKNVSDCNNIPDIESRKVFYTGKLTTDGTGSGSNDSGSLRDLTPRGTRN